MNQYATAIQDLQLQPDGVFGLEMPGKSIQLGTALGAVNDYDTIRIGGGTYSANQLVGKTILANRDTILYNGTSSKSSVYGKVKAGQPIGRVNTYIKASQSQDGRAWLGFDGKYPFFFFVPNENASTETLKDQGTETVKEEVKKEEDEKLKDESPVEYYVKKYATKVLIGIGLIVLASTVGRTLVTEGIKKIGSRKTEPTPAMSGVKKKRRVSKRKK
jgi:hypothetical protein